MRKRIHNLLCRLGFHKLVHHGPDFASCYQSDYCRGKVHRGR